MFAATIFVALFVGTTSKFKSLLLNHNCKYEHLRNLLVLLRLLKNSHSCVEKCTVVVDEFYQYRRYAHVNRSFCIFFLIV